MKLPAAIVDSHVHLWDPSRFRYAWLDRLPKLNRAFLSADFAAASATLSVGKMIFVECRCDSSKNAEEADWISALAKAEPRLCGIVAHAPLEEGEAVRAHLETLASRPLVKGVRRLLQGENDLEFCLHSEFVRGVEMLSEFGFTFDLCIRSEQLRAATELVRRVPEVQFILDHLGKPFVHARKMNPWAAELKSLAAFPNVSCKISGLTTEADWQNWQPADLKPFIETAVEAFNFDRLLFGGDWPVCSLATDYQRWIETVCELVPFANEHQMAQLFQTNAERIYRV